MFEKPAGKSRHVCCFEMPIDNILYIGRNDP
jgi:hypothetical protein